MTTPLIPYAEFEQIDVSRLEAIEATREARTFMTEDDSGEQIIQMSYVPAQAESDIWMVRVNAWSEYAGRAFDQRRVAAVAAIMPGVHFLSIDTPGMHADVAAASNNLTPLQLQGLKDRKPNSYDARQRSTFMPIAEAMNTAAKELIPDDAEVVLDGFSLGASTAGALAPLLQPEVLLLREHAARFTPAKAARIGAAFVAHSWREDGPNKKTNDWAPGIKDDGIGRIAKRWNQHWALVEGIAGSNLVRDIADAEADITDTRVVLMHGQNGISPRHENQLHEKFFSSRGVPVVRAELEGVQHSVHNSFTLNASMLREGIRLADQL